MGEKGELYNEFGASRGLMKEQVKHMNTTLESGNVPEEWKKSRTVMIPKTRKPTARS